MESSSIIQPVLPYSLKDLVARCERGESFEFLYFWGHTSRSSKVTRACLSQWYPCRFVIDGVEYNCTEQFMMAEKARLFGDEQVRAQILGSSDPAVIKALGRKVSNFDEAKWNEHSSYIVKRGNFAKFSQNRALLSFLEWTSGKILVEASPYDRIWGIGMKESDGLTPSQWMGKNKLGFALTEVRELIKAGCKELPDDISVEKQVTDKDFALFGDNCPDNGWAIVFAGGSASGKSTLIRNFSFKGEVLSTDSMGEDLMEVHNNPQRYSVEEPEKFELVEKIVKAGLYSRFPQRNVLNKVQNIRLDFDCPTVLPRTLSALLSNGAHSNKKAYFKSRIKDCAANGMKNLILDMTGKASEVEYYTDYLKKKGYKVALVWVVANRSVALLWNANRARSMKVTGVHKGHNNPVHLLLDLQEDRCDVFDEAWIVFNSTESIHRSMTEQELQSRVVQIEKKNGSFAMPADVASRITSVLGETDETLYIEDRWIRKFFQRIRMAKKVAIERGVEEPQPEQFLVSFLKSDKKVCEDRIKAFYQAFGMAEPVVPDFPNECYDVIEPCKEYFPNADELAEAIAKYQSQKAAYEASVIEWQHYNKQFEPNISISDMKEEQKEVTTFTAKAEDSLKSYKERVNAVADTVKTVEEADVTLLKAFFDRAKEENMPICFYAAGGALSPANFAVQLANEQGLVAMALSPMGVMTLSTEVIKKMLFLAVTATGNPADMRGTTEYLLGIVPDQVYCLTTTPLNKVNRFNQQVNKVGNMVLDACPEHAVCIALSIDSDGFVGTNKHVAISLLMYRAFFPDETGLADKVLPNLDEPYVSRLPEGMTLGDISDLHVVFGALGRAAANDMEGRMLEAGIIPAMATDFKNFTHGRHVFLDKHPQSTLLMLISPKDEKFVAKMMKLIPEERPVITIRTEREDILGALQLMISTFYLSIDIAAPHGINPKKPGAPKWGGKLWSLKLDCYQPKK